jgi:hypothetical protein
MSAGTVVAVGVGGGGASGGESVGATGTAAAGVAPFETHEQEEDSELLLPIDISWQSNLGVTPQPAAHFSRAAAQRGDSFVIFSAAAGGACARAAAAAARRSASASEARERPAIALRDER